ncbi:MAG: hypothetical protein Q9190_005854 [Brigantiaea leucoxantha]
MAGLISVLLFSAAGPAGAGSSEPAAALRCDLEQLPPAASSHWSSQWLADSRSFASRASQRASSATRRGTSRRPTIGAPSDFRRVELPNGRVPGFRPLQLSIYLPGNELPALPDFSKDAKEDSGGLEYPPQALVKSRSDSMLSRPSTSFSIPRKPVPSARAFSMDASRYSMESRDTDSITLTGTKSIVRRPSIIASQSTADFLDSLDARLPQTPPALRSKSGPEPVYTLYRRASEQSLRLRTHLEERQQIEKCLPECDTILEEKQPDLGNKVVGLSPILDHDESSPVSDLLSERRNESLAHHSRTDTSLSLASAPNGPRSPILRDVQPTSSSSKPSRRSIISQWLLRSIGSQTSFSVTPNAQTQHVKPDWSTHPPYSSRDRSSTGSSTVYSSYTAADGTSPWTTPYSSPHRRNESVSTYQTGGLNGTTSEDLAKMPTVVNVYEERTLGVAF